MNFLYLLAIVLPLVSADTYGLLKNERAKWTFIPYTAEQKLQVAKQAKDIISVYVNRESKIQNYGKEYPQIDPIPRVQSLVKKAANMTDKELHYEISDIFTSLRDFHTRYSLPAPHSCFIGVIGLRFDMVSTPGVSALRGDAIPEPRVIVSGKSVRPFVLQLSPAADKNVSIGDRLIRVNNQTFMQYYEANKYKTGGANLFGGQRSALQSISVRSGSQSPLPENDFMRFEFESVVTGKNYTIELPWVSIRLDKCYKESNIIMKNITGQDPLPDVDTLVDSSLSTVSSSRPLTIKEILKLFSNPFVQTLEKALPPRRGFRMVYEMVNGTDILGWSIYRKENENLGIIRLDSFKPENATSQQIIDAIRGLLVNELKDTSAILFDMRSNPGGYIDLADGLPQLFAGKYQAGLSRALIAPINDRIFRKLSGDPYSQSYLESDQSQRYSTPTSLSDDFINNRYGTTYLRPVGVLNNANCYSACDLFSAGMQDSGAAIIFGEDGKSGAGGANVVNTKDFFPKVVPEIFPYLPYSKNETLSELGIGPEFTVAWRQSVRVGRNKGKLVEDIGVQSDIIVRPSLKDIATRGNVSDQLSTISKLLRQSGEASGKNDRFFITDEAYRATGRVGESFDFHATMSGLAAIVILNQTGQITAAYEYEDFLNKNKRQVKIGVNQTVTELGTKAYQIIGTVGNQVILNTLRFVRFIPVLADYLTLSLKPFIYDFKPVKSLVMFNDYSKPSSGWQLKDGALMIGNGTSYDNMVQSRASFFFKTDSKVVSLKIKAEYSLEYACDFLVVGYESGNQTTLFTEQTYNNKTIPGISGNGTIDKIFTVNTVSSQGEFFMEFTSDPAKALGGIKISVIEISNGNRTLSS